MADNNGGVVLPGWEVVRKIGSGSTGSVYEIRNTEDSSAPNAALKAISVPQNPEQTESLRASGMDEKQIQMQYRSTAQQVAGVLAKFPGRKNVPNVVRCDEIRGARSADKTRWNVYIRTELLTPLAEAVSFADPEKQTAAMAADICNALEMCGKESIIHGNVKPQNIFAAPDGSFKLGDVCGSKAAEILGGGVGIEGMKYMAPEVYSSLSYSPASDVYSLGIVMYWMLNEGVMPFLPVHGTVSPEMERTARVKRLSGEKLPAPAHGRKSLLAIVAKACAANVQDRYPNAGAMLEDLKKLRLDEPEVPVAAPAVQAEKPAQEPAAQKTAEPAEKPVQKSTEAPKPLFSTPAPKPVAEPAAAKAEESAEKPVQKSAEAPKPLFSTPAQKSAPAPEMPAGKPAVPQKAEEKPAEKPAEKASAAKREDKAPKPAAHHEEPKKAFNPLAIVIPVVLILLAVAAFGVVHHWDTISGASSGGQTAGKPADATTEATTEPQTEAPTLPPVTEVFSDVSETDYYYDALTWAYENGLVSDGNSTFNGSKQITRAQVVTFIWRAMGSPEPKSMQTLFTDINADDYYYKATLWATEKGVTSGVDQTHFAPNDPVIRGQFVFMLWRADGTADRAKENPFTDVADTSYYYNAVMWAVGKGVVSVNDSGKFNPDKECTRAQAITMLYSYAQSQK